MKSKLFRSIAPVAMSVMLAAGSFSAMPAITAFAEDTETVTSDGEQNANKVSLYAIYTWLIDESSKFTKQKQDDIGYGTMNCEFDDEAENGGIILTFTPNEEYASVYDQASYTATFNMDEDGYLIFSFSEDDWWTLSTFYAYIIEAVANYTGMDERLITEYMTAAEANTESAPEGKDYVDSTFYDVYTDPDEPSLTIVRVYTLNAWDEDVVNEMLEDTMIDATAIDRCDVEPLDEYSSTAVAVNVGKYHAYAVGNKNELTLTMAVKGGYSNNEAAWKSLCNLVDALQPTGYEDFDYSGDVPEEKNNWSVYTPTGDQIPDIFDEYDDNYELVQVTFATPYVTNGSSVSLKAGETDYMWVNNGYVEKFKSSNPKVAKVNNDGYITALKKGKAVITATLSDGTTLTYTVKVTSNPKLKVGGKAFKASKTYTVKKGKTLKVKISGKASDVNNKYTSTKVAKVTSKKSAQTVKIKGLKKGMAKVTIKVNGVSFKIKVKVV